MAVAAVKRNRDTRLTIRDAERRSLLNTTVTSVGPNTAQRATQGATRNVCVQERTAA
jgi:hypothetical protein